MIYKVFLIESIRVGTEDASNVFVVDLDEDNDPDARVNEGVVIFKSNGKRIMVPLSNLESIQECEE